MSIDERQIIADWRERGFRPRMWTGYPGREWRGYRYEEDALFLILDGAMLIEMDGQTIQPGPGEEVLIPAGTVHDIVVTGGDTARWLYGRRKG